MHLQSATVVAITCFQLLQVRNLSNVVIKAGKFKKFLSSSGSILCHDSTNKQHA